MRAISCLLVADEIDEGVQADAFVRIVDVGQPDRHAGGEREMIEAGLPVIGTRARAFGCQRQVQAFNALELALQLRDQAGALAPVDRKPAECAQQRAERRAEQSVLAAPMHRPADAQISKHADDEIPVGSVRIENHHALGRGRPAEVHAPAGQAQQPRAQPPRCRHRVRHQLRARRRRRCAGRSRVAAGWVCYRDHAARLACAPLHGKFLAARSAYGCLRALTGSATLRHCANLLPD